MYSYIVVDDEAIIRKGLIKKIEKLGMPLKCIGQATNGTEGMKLIYEANPDIVITDMKMPEMDGVDFLDSIERSYPDKKITVLSSYDDFKYMNTAIENRVIGYVLKPFSGEEIQKQLSKAIKQIEQQKFINNQLGSMREYINTFEKRAKNQKLLDFILHPVIDTEVVDKLQQKDYRGMKEFLLMGITTTNPSLLEQLESICTQSSGGVTTVALEDVSKRYGYFIVLMDQETGKIGRYADNIAEKLVMLDTDDVLYVFISRTCRNMRELHDLYKEYNEKLPSVRLSDRKTILRPDSRLSDRVHTDEEIKDIFVDIRHNPDCIANRLGKFFEELAASNASFGVIKRECSYLIDLVNEYASQCGIESKEIMDDFLVKYIFEDKIERIKQEVSDYVTHTLNSAVNSSQSQEHLVEKIKQYINENYNLKITLESIASEFFLNPTYVSYVFKLKNRENFNDYLTKVRLNKAKQLLAETNISIDCISKEIGYKNEKYFFKTFKKHTGLTPMEYRNRKQV